MNLFQELKPVNEGQIDLRQDQIDASGTNDLQSFFSV